MQLSLGLTCVNLAGHGKPLHMTSVMLHGLVPVLTKPCVSECQAQSIGIAM